MNTKISASYLLGLTLFLLILLINLMAIQQLFNEGNTAAIVGSLLVLECLLTAWSHYQCKSAQDCCPPAIKSSVNHFNWLLTLLSISSVLFFASQDLGTDALLSEPLRLLFWVIFAGLTVIGLRLAFSSLGGNSQPPAGSADSDASSSPFGQAGYKC